MARQHIVVDGSNIATEGRSSPSLKQLEEAVTELKREHPGAEVTVIVDATFAHRIDPSELDEFEKAALAGEYVHPPAGAIGRGDAFLLRVAEKVNGTVLSNDSFQEFHGEHPWLFERGRLLGATPVPGIGWIFSPRTPVRGPASRQAVRDSERAKRQVSKAIEVATKEAVTPPGGNGHKPRIGDRGVLRQGRPTEAARHARTGPAAVNDPLTFVSFIAEHPLGAEVRGRVDSYTSHGAVVMVGTVQCYVPLSNLGNPPPRSAREVLKRGEDATFVVRALDPQRRGVELALPGVGTVSGTPSEEMIEAEVRLARKRQPAPVQTPAAVGGRAAKKAVSDTAGAAKPGAEKAGVTKAGATKAGATKAGATKDGGTKTGATKAAAKKAGLEKAAPVRPSGKVTTDKAPAVKKSAAKTQGADKTSVKGAPKVPAAKQAAVKKTSSPRQATPPSAAAPPAKKAAGTSAKRARRADSAGTAGIEESPTATEQADRSVGPRKSPRTAKNSPARR